MGKRGFGSMSEEKRKAISSKGGKTAHERGLAHQFTTDEAKEAGRKGGQEVSKNKAHMAAIGRAGGMAPRKPRAKKVPAEAKLGEVPTTPAPQDEGEG